MKPHYLTQSIRVGLLLSATLATTTYAEQSVNNTDANNTEKTIEKIMVTGQKFDRSLQETTTSVIVLTDKMMTEKNINSFTDIIERTPNTSNSNKSFTIRGIDAFNVSGGGNSYLASVYLDGAPLPYQMIRQGAFSTWDVNQVEILRGPQSSLQGRNALAGAIVMTSQAPSYEWGGKYRLGIGEYGKREAAIAFGGGLVDDQIAFRLSAEHKQLDGFTKNITRNSNSDFDEEQTYRLKVRFEPTSMPELSALLSYTYNDMENGIRSSNSNETNKRITTFDSPTFNFTDNQLLSLALDYELNDSWTLTSISSYSDSQYGYEWDGDYTAEPMSILVDDRNDKTISQELRAVFDYEKFTGVLGLYYSNLEVNETYSGDRHIPLSQLGAQTLLTAPPASGGLGLPLSYAEYVMSLYGPVDPLQLMTNSDIYQEVSNSAIFFDASYQLNQQWELIIGARWDHEQQKNTSNNLVTFINSHLLPDPSSASLDPNTAMIVANVNHLFQNMVDDASGNPPLTDASFTEFLPKIGINYHWSEDISSSFIVQRGYRSGGIGTNIAQSSSHTYDAEYTNNYEISFRSVWLDSLLTFNANAFYIDWQDQQVEINLSTNQYDSETKNSGRSTVKGLESELSYQVTEQLNLYAGIGYADTKFNDFMIEVFGNTWNLAGLSFKGAPKWTANLGASYRSDSGFNGNININYTGNSRAIANPFIGGLNEQDSNFNPRNDSRAIVNTRLGYQWQDFSLYLVGTNIFNQNYITSADTGLGNHTLGSPRQVTLRFEGQF